MTEPALVGDIGGTNSRFGLVARGSLAVADVEVLRNDDFASLEAAIGAYRQSHRLSRTAAAAIAVAGPVTGEIVSLTNRDWRFTRTSLQKAAGAERLRLLNDFEALALSLPHLASGDLVQIGGETAPAAGLKIVMGPGTGLGMAALAPLPQGGWMALPGEIGHVTLPVVTAEEFDWRQKMTRPGTVFTAEDALSGGGLLAMYRTLAPAGRLASPEAVLAAALGGTDRQAALTVEQFVTWLARLAGDAAMAMQARGGVYLAGGIAVALTQRLRAGPFRAIFEDKGKMAHAMKPIPVYVIVDRFPALKGCAAALAW